MWPPSPDNDAMACSQWFWQWMGWSWPDPCCIAITKTKRSKTQYFAANSTFTSQNGCSPIHDNNGQCMALDFTTQITPTLTITPLSGNQSGSITIDITPNYGSTLSWSISIDGGTATPLTTNWVTGTYNIDTTWLSNASHTAIAYDVYNWETLSSAQITFTVSNVVVSPPSDSGSGSTWTVSTTSIWPVLPADINNIGTFFSWFGTPKNTDQSEKITEYTNLLEQATIQTELQKCKGICLFWNN